MEIQIIKVSVNYYHKQSQLQKEKSAIEKQCELTLMTERNQLEDLRTSLEKKQQQLEVERQTLHAQFEAGVQREREQLERERGALRQLMEEEVSRELHVQMEVGYVCEILTKHLLFASGVTFRFYLI